MTEVKATAKKAVAKKVASMPLSSKVDFAAIGAPKPIKEELKHTRGSYLDSTPVPGWVKDSYEDEQPMSVPAATQVQADALEAMIRASAARQGIGVKVKVEKQGDGFVVKFQAKDKKKYDKEAAAAKRAAKAAEAAKTA